MTRYVNCPCYPDSTGLHKMPLLPPQVVESISKSLIDGSKSKNNFLHISCSTISPSSARRFATLHSESGHKLVTAPVFARPDGNAFLVHMNLVSSHKSAASKPRVLHLTSTFHSFCCVSLTGIAKRQATWMLGGEAASRQTASELLSSLGNIVDMGDDVGAANVVKLCGNFLIAVCVCLAPAPAWEVIFVWIVIQMRL